MNLPKFANLNEHEKATFLASVLAGLVDVAPDSPFALIIQHDDKLYLASTVDKSDMFDFLTFCAGQAKIRYSLDHERN